MDRPSTKDGYSRREVSRVEAACRYVCERLGSLSEHVTIIGGLVPSLIIPEDSLSESAERHCGTMDVDLGLILGHRTVDRLEQTRQLLLDLGFTADAKRPPMRFRYIMEGESPIIVDLICATEPDSHQILANSMREVAPGIARQIALAFEDRIQVRLHGPALTGDIADCLAFVCGPGAFVVIKALTFRSRRENKDAYDLYYVLQNYNGGPAAIFPRLAPLLRTQEGKEAIRVLQEEFGEHDGPGPIAVATFLTSGPDDNTQADVVSLTMDVLRMCGVGEF
jgi:hypothetical protein